MKSKSLILPSETIEQVKANKTYDFLNYYKTASENIITLKDKNDSDNAGPKTQKRRQTPNKVKKKFKGEMVNVSKIDIDGSNLNSDSGKRSPLNESKITSTPNVSKAKNPSIKSIMKGTPGSDTLDISNVPRAKPKKRNKSVSFMLEDNEEVVIKKTKSNETLVAKNLETKKVKKNKNKLLVKEDKENNNLKNDNADDTQNKEINKNKQKQKGKKANKNETNTKTDMDIEIGGGDTNQSLGDNTKTHKSKEDKSKIIPEDTSNERPNEIKKKRRKRGKKNKGAVTTEDENNSAKESTEMTKKTKKPQKTKHAAESPESEQPVKKSKKSNKPDVIAKAIENLNIGDNAHTLTNLLDEMSVDKTKKKNKNKTKNKKATETSEESKEVKKPKRSNRRKNRNLNAVVIVQNLPFSIILNYRKILKDYFSKFGKVHSVGIADLKCSENDAKPIFTTRIFFLTEQAAAEALTEDKSLFENNIIRVKKYVAPATRPVKHGSWTKNPMRNKMTKNDDKSDEVSDKMVDENQESASDSD